MAVPVSKTENYGQIRKTDRPRPTYSLVHRPSDESGNETRVPPGGYAGEFYLCANSKRTGVQPWSYSKVPFKALPLLVDILYT